MDTLGQLEHTPVEGPGPPGLSQAWTPCPPPEHLQEGVWLCREVGSFKLPFQEEATAWGEYGGSRKDLLCPCRSSYSAVPSGLAYFLLEVRGGSGRFSLHSEYEQRCAVFAWWWAALGDSPWQEGAQWAGDLCLTMLQHDKRPKEGPRESR